MFKWLFFWVGTVALSSWITYEIYEVNIDIEKMHAAREAKLFCETQLAINKVYTCDGECREEQILNARKARAAMLAYMHREGEWSK